MLSSASLTVCVCVAMLCVSTAGESAQGEGDLARGHDQETW